MGYKSIFENKTTTTPQSGGRYVSMFAKPVADKPKYSWTGSKETGFKLIPEKKEIPQERKVKKSPNYKEPRFADILGEAYNIVSSPFRKFGKGFKEQYKERQAKTPEEKEKEQATRNLAGLEGKMMQEKEAKKLEEGTSATSYEDLTKLTKEEEERTQKSAEFVTMPVKFLVGYPVQALASYALEETAKHRGVELKYTPTTDAEKLLIGKEEIQRLSKQEDMYGMIARGVGIPAALITMAIVENPFLKSTGISVGIKQALKRKMSKEGSELVVKMGAKELSSIVDEAIEIELKAGRITEKEAVKATEEVAKMKKTPAKPKKTEFGEFLKKEREEKVSFTKKQKAKDAKAKQVKYIPEEKPVDLRKKVTTEKLITTPKVSKRISDETIEKGLLEDMGNLPDRDIIKFKDQARLVGDIIDENPEKAIKIALGKELPTNGALPESVFMAVKRQALRNGDTDLLRKLATEEGGVASEASTLGARIKMLDESGELADDAFSSMNRLAKERKAKFEKKGKSVSKEKKAETKKIKETIKKPDKYDWDRFINSIEC